MQIFLTIVSIIHIVAAGLHCHLAAWWHDRAQYRTFAYIGGRCATKRNINIAFAVVNMIAAGAWLYIAF